MFFSVFMLGLTALQARYTAYKPSHSEEFSSASRSVKPGLIASGIVSAWTWAATLVRSYFLIQGECLSCSLFLETTLSSPLSSFLVWLGHSGLFVSHHCGAQTGSGLKKRVKKACPAGVLNPTLTRINPDVLQRNFWRIKNKCQTLRVVSTGGFLPVMQY